MLPELAALAALFSAITAAMVVVIALWNGYITRQGAQSSIEPAFSAWADYPETEEQFCTLLLANKGFGPGIVTSFELFCDGTRVEGHLFKKVRNALRAAFGHHLQGIDKAPYYL